MAYSFKPQDRPLFNTGFWEGYNACKGDAPNAFWASPGEDPVTLETNKSFLENLHQDRVFAEAALLGMAAHAEVVEARERRVKAQKEVEQKRKTLKPEDPPLGDIPEVDDLINTDLHWEEITAPPPGRR